VFILSNLLVAIATVLHYGLNLYMWVFIIRALISWVNPDPYNPIVRFLYSITDPVLYTIRRKIPVMFGGFDFSPLIVIMSIVFIQKFIVSSLFQIAGRIATG